MSRGTLTCLIALAASAALVLSACGGGGCNPCDGPEVPTPSVNCSTSGVCK
jgi:hypothetical protein